MKQRPTYDIIMEGTDMKRTHVMTENAYATRGSLVVVKTATDPRNGQT